MDVTAHSDSIKDATRQACAMDISPETIAALPSLEELRVPQEMLEAAAELADASDVLGLERYRLEVLVRFLLHHDRRRDSNLECR